MLTVYITSGLVVGPNGLITNDKAVSLHDWLKGITNTHLFHTTGTNLFHRTVVVFKKDRTEYLTKHTVTEVTLVDDCLDSPLLGLLSEQLKGLIGVTITETSSFHKVDITVQGVQHSVTCFVLTSTTWVNDQNLLLILTRVI